MACQNESEDDGFLEERSWCHTQFKKYVGSLTWKIVGFSLCSYEPGEVISSPEFGIVGVEENSWKLCLYPNGKTDVQKDFMAVFLHLKTGMAATEPVTCEISIIDASGETTETKELTYYSNESAGIEEFIARSSLLDLKDLLLPDDELTVRCELATVKKLEKNWKSCSKRPRCPQSSCSVNNLAVDFGKLLESNDQFSDVVLIVDSEKFTAHKVVLMTRSPVFATMFQQNMREAQTNTVIVKDIEVEVFKELLCYIYTNTCNFLSVLHATHILVAADKYDIPSLKSLCSDYLSVHLSKEHVLDVVVCADAVGDSQLRQNCVDFICDELPNLITVHSEWRSKLRSSPQVLEEILQLRGEKERYPEKFMKGHQLHCNAASKTTSLETHFVEKKAYLKWKITGIIMCNLDTGKYFRSPDFGFSGEESLFCLVICPKETVKEDKTFLSMFFRAKSSFKDHVELEVSIRNVRKEVIALKEFSLNCPPSFTGGILATALVPREQLLRQIIADECIVNCSISASRLCLGSSIHSPQIDHRQNSLTQDFRRQFEHREFADVELS